MTEYSERTEELLAAAAAGDLSAQEQAELDVLRAKDPSIDSTLAELNSLLPQLRASHWEEAEPPARLAEAVSRLPEQQPAFGGLKNGGPNNDGPMNAVAPNDVAPAAEPVLADASRPPAAPSNDKPRSKRSAFALVAAVSVIAGAGGTVAVQYVNDSPPDGPPGTYGAVEDISFSVDPTDVEVDGSLVAHTWGTETVLEIEGLESGESFTVVLVADDGEEFASGTFFGSEVMIECRMNAAVMRDDVGRVQITGDDGDVIAEAQLPAAIDPDTEDGQAEGSAGPGQ